MRSAICSSLGAALLELDQIVKPHPRDSGFLGECQISDFLGRADLRLLFHHQPLKPPRYRAQAEGPKESLPNTKKRKQSKT